MSESKGRVVVAMSGGVDSSVAAAVLRRDGYDVTGLFMRTGSQDVAPDRRSKTCCSVADAIDARRVADRLDIPFYALDFEADFGRIVENFIDEYFAGRTPNPCVMCNIWLKFGKLWAYGRSIDATYVATGHYAKITDRRSTRPALARARDLQKDQSYVLSGLKPAVLPNVLFPLGELTKPEVREIARDLGLPVHDKPESQEICFVPNDDYVAFIRSHAPNRSRPGEIQTLDGTVVGAHSGIEAFTVGQRRGLGVAVGEPRYVVGIDPQSATVRIGPRDAVDRAGLLADRFHWHIDPPRNEIDCFVQIRAHHRAVRAQARTVENVVEVRFNEPQTAVTPGQVVALYDTENQSVLGGGWIAAGIDQAAIDLPQSHAEASA